MIKNYKSSDLADNLGMGYGKEVRHIMNIFWKISHTNS